MASESTEIQQICARYKNNLEAFYRDFYVLARERIVELEAQLAEANARAEANYYRMPRRGELGAALERAETAEAQAEAAEKWARKFAEQRDEIEVERDKLRAALENVELYFANEDGPIYRLWENCDIGRYDDYQQPWDETLADCRNFNVDAAIVGAGTEWPEVLLYREILQALAPQAEEEK